MPSPRPLLSLLVACSLLGCARGPTMVVSVENVPPDAASLSLFATHQSDSGVLPSMEDLHPYDLPQPAPNPISFLLRLPDGFSGDFTVNVAAMKSAGGDGCLMRTGTTSRVFMSGLLDDAMTVSLKEPEVQDPQCTGSLRLFAASPRYGRTAGGEQVTLLGWGFRPGADVYFGETKAPSVNYVSATSLQVTTPRSAVSGPVPLKVTNSDGVQISADRLFQYAFDTIGFTPGIFPIGDQITDFTFAQVDKTLNDQPDIVYTDTTSEVCAVFFPSYKATCYTEAGPVSNLGLIDINRDGNVDTVVAIPSKDQVSVRTNNGAGDLSKQRSFSVTSGPVVMPSAVATGDLDGDGAADVVTVNQSTPATVSVLLNDGNGGLRPVQSFPIKSVTVPADVAMLDLNGDQRNDLFIVDKMSGKAIVLLNQGTPTLFDGSTSGSGYIPLTVGTPGGPTPSLSIHDVNVDGRLDLANSIESENTVAIGISTGQLSGSTTSVMTPSPHRVKFGDINGDGLPDLAVLNSSAASVEIFLQQRRVLPMDPYFVNPSALSIPLSATIGTPVQIALTDLPPADGRLDVVVAGTKALAFLQNSSR